MKSLGPKIRTAYLRAMAAFAVIAVATACNSASRHQTSRPTLVPASALEGLLLSADEVAAVMGTNAMVADTPFVTARDHRILMPNLNCLGIWEVGESAVYKDSGFSAIRGQLLRQPDTNDWQDLVIQAGVIFPSTEAARAFFSASVDRWTNCTNHRVNITLNDQPKKTWWFGNLTKTDTELSMPVIRGASERTCQHVLSVSNNVIVDVLACSPTATDQAATIAQKMKDRLPH